MTLYPAATRGDALRVLTAEGVEIVSLAVVGTIPGVVPLAAAGLGGPGTGRLRSAVAPGGLATLLQWRAPGSETWGQAVDASAGGDLLLEDGETPDAWLRVRVHASWLSPVPAEALVLVRDRYNAHGPADVDAEDAEAGDVSVVERRLYNASPHQLQGLRAWLGPSAPGLELSDDGESWSSPTSEGEALELGDVEPGAYASLYVQRTIGAAALSDAAVTNQLRFSWKGA